MYVIDTSFWVSFLNEADVNHQKAVRRFEEVSVDDIVLIDYIYGEVLTVLALKVGEEYVQNFVDLLSKLGIDIEFVHREIFEEANRIFFENRDRGISFIDAAVLATALKKKVEVWSFDKALLTVKRSYL